MLQTFLCNNVRLREIIGDCCQLIIKVRQFKPEAKTIEADAH